MAQTDAIAVSISEADLAEIRASFMTLRTKLLPHLTTLSSNGRQQTLAAVTQEFPRSHPLRAADLYRQSVSLRPELATRFVFVSGDPGSLQMAEFTRRTGVPVMPKPFDQGRLDKFIRDAVGR